MKIFFVFAVLATGGLAMLPQTASAAGCVSGAAVGGVAGHLAGHHSVLGAAAGCAVGHHEAVKQQRGDAATQTYPTPRGTAGRPDRNQQ